MPLKFLCLPGAYTNADTLRVQLGPIVKALESEGLLSFHFTQGAYEADPPPGFETWFGNPPHLRFLQNLKFSDFDWQARLRFFEPLDNSEDSMRELFQGGEVPSTTSIHDMLDPLHRVLEEDGPFHGVLGYSEGASVAATLLVSNQRRCEAQGIENTLTNAIFFSGAPPLDPDGEALLLADQCGQVITARTIHVLSASDPFLHGCLALYNLCDEEEARIFDHGKGHLVPREARVVKDFSAFVHRYFVTARHS